MRKTCAVCGQKYDLLDLVGQPLMCVRCTHSGTRLPEIEIKLRNTRHDLLVGRTMTIGGAALLILFIWIRGREGDSLSSKYYLVALAFGAITTGFLKMSGAKRTIARLRKERRRTR